MSYSHKCGWEGRNHPPRGRVTIICHRHSFLLPSSTSMQNTCSCNPRLVIAKRENKVSVMKRINLKQNAGRLSYEGSPRAGTRNYEHAASNTSLTRLAVDSRNQEYLCDNRQSHAAKVSQNHRSSQPYSLDRQLRAKRATADYAASIVHAV